MSSKFLVISGGKGGIGKTNIAVNLALALRALDYKVALLDMDTSFANVDVLLGISSKKNLKDVLEQKLTLDSAFVDGPNGIAILPGSSGIEKIAKISTAEIAGFMDLFQASCQKFDYVVVDTPAGINDTAVYFANLAHEILMVVCNEPASITDAYALIKLLYTNYNLKRFNIVTNKINYSDESVEIFAKLTRVADQFLNVSLRLAGAIPEDTRLKQAVMKRRAVMELYPQSESADAFKKLAFYTLRLLQIKSLENIDG